MNNNENDLTKKKFYFTDSGFGGIECMETHWDLMARLVNHPMWHAFRLPNTYSRIEMAVFFSQILRAGTKDVDELCSIGHRMLAEVFSQ
jgi:hypothetical protein